MIKIKKVHTLICEVCTFLLPNYMLQICLEKQFHKDGEVVAYAALIEWSDVGATRYHFACALVAFGYPFGMIDFGFGHGSY